MTNDETNLRDLLFKHKSKDLFPGANLPSNQAWGMVMETAYEDASVTVFCATDGSASMYYSNGGGIIGAGEHQDVAELASAIAHYSSLFFLPYATQEFCKDFPYPEMGSTAFYFLSDDGAIKTPEIAEEMLGNDESILSPLFHTFHALIGAIIEHTPQGQDS